MTHIRVRAEWATEPSARTVASGNAEDIRASRAVCRVGDAGPPLRSTVTSTGEYINGPPWSCAPRNHAEKEPGWEAVALGRQGVRADSRGSALAEPTATVWATRRCRTGETGRDGAVG